MTYLLAQASAHRIPLRDASVQTCVTSPPYWGLRAYAGEQSFVWGGDAEHDHEWGEEGRSGQRNRHSETTGEFAREGRAPTMLHPSTGAFCLCGAWRGALGLEPTPDLFVEHMVQVFREVRRVLRNDGTLWLNLGDSYAQANARGGTSNDDHVGGHHNIGFGSSSRYSESATVSARTAGLKPKDLVGIPWRVAFALQADGWYLRSDIIWAKPNPMPESVTDRPTKSHEYVFMLSKSERYFYDADAIREEAIHEGRVVKASNPETAKNGQKGVYGTTARGFTQHDTLVSGRNARSVWNIATQPYPGAHFATFPDELPERCMKAGSALGDVVLDPFNGSGTTGRVAMRLGRRYVGLDLSREYLVEQAVARIDPIAAAARDFREKKDGAQGALL